MASNAIDIWTSGMETTIKLSAIVALICLCIIYELTRR